MDCSRMRKAQLIEEIQALQEQIAEPERAQAERVRVQEEIKQRNRELSALNAIAATVNQSLDLREVLIYALEKVLDIMELEVGGIHLLEEQGGTLVLKAHRGLDLSPHFVERLSRVKLAESPLAEAVATSEPVIIKDISAHPIFELMGRRDLMSLAVIPLRSKDRVLGIMEVVSPDARQFTSKEIQLLTSIGHQIGVAVENARLYGDLERQLKRISVLADLAKAISSTLELDQLLEVAVERAAQLTEAKIATIRLIEGEHLNVGVAVGYQDPAAREHLIKIDRRLARIVEEGQPLILPDLEADPDLPPTRRERMRREGVRAYLGVPMIAKGKPLGILSVYRKESHAWSGEEVAFAFTIANQVAIAAEIAQLYESAQQEITERVRAEEALRKAHDELEIRVQERTAELAKANEALQAEIAERKRAEEQLVHMATHDPLTGLPNRMLFNDRLTVALAHAYRSHQKLAVMMLDLDHFKDVNDTLGHSVGDRLLQAVGRRLTSLLRKSDTVARMGGDEFTLIFPGIAQVESVTMVAQKILEAFRRPFVCDSHELCITTSIGIAMYPFDGEDADTLMKNADIAMYRVKEQGRDNYQRYTPAMKAEAPE